MKIVNPPPRSIQSWILGYHLNLSTSLCSEKPASQAVVSPKELPTAPEMANRNGLFPSSSAAAAHIANKPGAGKTIAADAIKFAANAPRYPALPKFSLPVKNKPNATAITRTMKPQIANCTWRGWVAAQRNNGDSMAWTASSTACAASSTAWAASSTTCAARSLRP